MGHTRRATRQFTFLQQKCAPVFGAASEAELAVCADPRTACFHARRSPGRLLTQAELVFEYWCSDAVVPTADGEKYREGFFRHDARWHKINLGNDRQSCQDGLCRIELAPDRGTNKALLLKHIRDNAASGAQMEEFRQVLPALSRSQIQVLLRELRGEGSIHKVGVTNAAHWYPGADRDCNPGEESP